MFRIKDKLQSNIVECERIHVTIEVLKHVIIRFRFDRIYKCEDK